MTRTARTRTLRQRPLDEMSFEDRYVWNGTENSRAATVRKLLVGELRRRKHQVDHDGERMDGVCLDLNVKPSMGKIGRFVDGRFQDRVPVATGRLTLHFRRAGKLVVRPEPKLGYQLMDLADQIEAAVAETQRAQEPADVQETNPRSIPSMAKSKQELEMGHGRTAHGLANICSIDPKIGRCLEQVQVYFQPHVKALVEYLRVTHQGEDVLGTPDFLFRMTPASEDVDRIRALWCWSIRQTTCAFCILFSARLNDRNRERPGAIEAPSSAVFVDSIYLTPRRRVFEETAGLCGPRFPNRDLVLIARTIAEVVQWQRDAEMMKNLTQRYIAQAASISGRLGSLIFHDLFRHPDPIITPEEAQFEVPDPAEPSSPAPESGAVS